MRSVFLKFTKTKYKASTLTLITLMKMQSLLAQKTFYNCNKNISYRILLQQR